MYNSYIHSERIEEGKRQLAQENWEKYKTLLMGTLADLFEGREPFEELKAMSKYMSPDYQAATLSTLFILGQWPDDPSKGLTPDQTEQLRAALKTHYPDIFKTGLFSN